MSHPLWMLIGTGDAIWYVVYRLMQLHASWIMLNAVFSPVVMNCALPVLPRYVSWREEVVKIRVVCGLKTGGTCNCLKIPRLFCVYSRTGIHKKCRITGGNRIFGVFHSGDDTDDGSPSCLPASSRFCDQINLVVVQWPVFGSNCMPFPVTYNLMVSKLVLT
jgi:hypothetical protein